LGVDGVVRPFGHLTLELREDVEVEETGGDGGALCLLIGWMDGCGSRREEEEESGRGEIEERCREGKGRGRCQRAAGRGKRGEKNRGRDWAKVSIRSLKEAEDR
jgi:hypothetical protein